MVDKKLEEINRKLNLLSKIYTDKRKIYIEINMAGK